MFRKQERINILEAQVKGLQKELRTQDNTIERLEKENKRFRSDLDYEHEENYVQHQKLREIGKILDEQDYGNIANLKARIKTIIKNDLVKEQV